MRHHPPIEHTFESFSDIHKFKIVVRRGCDRRCKTMDVTRCAHLLDQLTWTVLSRHLTRRLGARHCGGGELAHLNRTVQAHDVHVLDTVGKGSRLTFIAPSRHLTRRLGARHCGGGEPAHFYRTVQALDSATRC